MAGIAPAASAGTASPNSTASPNNSASPNTAPQYRFSTYNICGNHCSSSDYSNTQRLRVVEDEGSPTGGNADDIFLQEVCKSQFDSIDAQLRTRGYTGLFDQTKAVGSGTCSGSPYGIAMFTKGAVVQTKVLHLKIGGEPTDEDIASPCVESFIQGRLHWGCSVHLYWDSSTYSALEAQKLASLVRPWQEAGIPVVLGGDFNASATTSTLDSFYQPGMAGSPHGSFREADQTDKNYFNTSICTATQSDCRSGEPTYVDLTSQATKKIDYLFFSQNAFTNVSGDVLARDVTVSDHRLYRGTATMTSASMGETTDVGDRNGDGVDDFVAVERSTGDLYLYTSSAYSGANRTQLGWSWDTMRDLVDVGDHNGDGIADLIAVDTADDHMYLYSGPGFSGTTRVDLGGGWDSYTDLATVGDRNGDGVPDFVATDAATGNLYLYTSPNYLGSQRQQIGTGWTGTRDITDVGDHNGDGQDDFVAVNDTDTTMYLYSSPGFTGSTRVALGGGWGGYGDIAAIGRQNSDKQADFVATDTSTGSLYLYTSPSYLGSQRQQIGSGW
ncbi:FG-GAP-like repeat-containing protein [Catenulispora acidiphila]|uniref:FG-GAP-like repeat-containing protein n=1 Tax=Catenulispora acidiphila TaxID=304895 RepID=UPI00019DF6F5|nr:VCBS repeat-containing protein [Catenulispora acidiphila]